MTNSQKQKIEALLMYLIQALQSSAVGGTKTKLYKLLYFMDFGAYAKYNISITNLSYLKFKFGPVPLGVDTLLKLMEENGNIQKQWVSDAYDGHYIYNLPSQNSSPKFVRLHVSLLSAYFASFACNIALHLQHYPQNKATFFDEWDRQKKEVIDITINHFKNTYAFQLSKETHHHYSWITTENSQIISYEKSKYCDFDWLGYFYDKTKEEYLEDKKTRQLLEGSAEIDQLMSSLQNL